MWKSVKLKDIVNLSIGKTPLRASAKFWDREKKTKNIWISIRDLSALGGLYVEDSKEYVSDEGAKLFKSVPADTLIMSFKLSIGKLAITKCELRTNEAIAALTIKDEKLVIKEYLYYFLSSINWDYVAGNDVKVKGKTLNKAKLGEITISLPPLAEQQRIVAKLDAVFAEIDKSNRLVEYKIIQLKKLKKLTLPQILKESNSRNVTLGEICEIIGGGTPSKNNPKFFGGNIPWATVRDMKSDNIETTEFSITKEGLMNSSTRVIEKGNIVIATRVGLGKVCVLKKDTAINQDLKGIIPKIKELDTNYLFYCLKNITEKIIAAGRGATVQGVKLPFIKSLSLLLPSIKEQKIITAKLIEVFERIEVASNSLLKSQKNYIALKSVILKQEMCSNLE